MFDTYLIRKGNVVVQKDNGFVGSNFYRNDNLQLCIVFPDSENFKVLHHIKKDGQYELADLKPASVADGFATYVIAMKVALTKNDNIPYACLPHNNKNHVIVEIAEGETVRTFKVGVVSQKGRFFLLSREYSAKQESNDEIPDNTGRVEWFDVFSGVGCLKIKDNTARIYWDCLVHPDIDEPYLAEHALIELQPGEWVIFNKLSEPSEKRTEFKQEISGSALVQKERPNQKELETALSWLEMFSTPKLSNWAPKLGDICKTR